MKVDISKERIKELKKDSKIKNSAYHVLQTKENNIFKVESFSDPIKFYMVFLDKRNKFYCECKGFTFKQTCGHVDSVKHFLSLKRKFSSSDKLGGLS